MISNSDVKYFHFIFIYYCFIQNYSYICGVVINNTIKIMKNLIEILNAWNLNQNAIIDGVRYDFEFDTRELAVCINNNHSTSELEAMSGLDSADYTSFEMCEEIASDWNHDDVILLIADFIADNSDKLIDHLTVNAN